MAKTVDIPIEKWVDSLKNGFKNCISWLNTFFHTIDTYETIAVAAIILGLLLFVAGLILL